MRTHKAGPGRYPQRGYYAPENPNLSQEGGPRRRARTVAWWLTFLVVVLSLGLALALIGLEALDTAHAVLQAEASAASTGAEL